jgi:hypothetical protein
MRPDEATLPGLPKFRVYADDTGFGSLGKIYLDLDRRIEMLDPMSISDFELILYLGKTENTRLGH